MKQYVNKKFLQRRKDIRKSSKRTVLFIKDKDGNLIREEEQKLKTWLEYFKQLFSMESDEARIEQQDMGADNIGNEKIKAPSQEK